jgi:hypothetical protein
MDHLWDISCMLEYSCGPRSLTWLAIASTRVSGTIGPEAMLYSNERCFRLCVRPDLKIRRFLELWRCAHEEGCVYFLIWNSAHYDVVGQDPSFLFCD